LHGCQTFFKLFESWKGIEMKYYIDCLKCKGIGWIYESSIHDLGDVAHVDCPECEGTGKEEATEEYLKEITNAGAIK